MLNLRLQRPTAPIQPPAPGFQPLPFLIYTLKIRNRRKARRISHLRFSNRGSGKASASRANNVSRGTSLPFLICTENIRNPRSFLRITNLHFSNLYKLPALFLSNHVRALRVAAKFLPARSPLLDNL